MKITDALLGEHGALYLLFDQLEKTLPQVESLEELQGLVRMFEGALIGHALLEEELLFQPLAVVAGSAGPLFSMREQHQAMETELLGISQLDDLNEIMIELSEVIKMARGHFAREEQLLYRIAETQLGLRQLEELGDRWAKARGVTLSRGVGV